MIKVIVKKELKHLRKVEVSGHANYEEYGKDIVCASASSIVITSLNAILSIDENALDVISKKGYISANLKSKDKDILKVFANMINMLQELSSNYPKNITVRNEE